MKDYYTKPNTTAVSPLISRDGLLTSPKAVARRVRLLTDDAHADRVNESRRRSGQRKKGLLLTLTRTNRISLERLKFHLSRGRDVGDIAIRENVTVSAVRQAISEIKGA